MLDRADTYYPGTFVYGEYAGYQEETQIACSFGEDKCVWFIKYADTVTEYRWRSIY